MADNDKSFDFEEILSKLKSSPEDLLEFYRAEKLVLKDRGSGSGDSDGGSQTKLRVYEDVIVIATMPDWAQFIDNEGKFHWIPADKIDEIVYVKDSKEFFMQMATLSAQEIIKQLITLRDIQARDHKVQGFF